jgi:polyhydroxyalkanoate synthase
MTWLGSRGSLPLSAGNLPAWKPELRAALTAIEASLADADKTEFAAAVEREAGRRFDRLNAGILAYQQHPYRRALADPPVLWREGSTRLLDYRSTVADKSAPALLVVPSLINRSYVLDLAPGRSLMRDLAGRGFRPVLVDWGAPDEAERRFGLDDYVAGRLNRVLDAVIKEVGGPILLVGYCMGGLLTLALALRRQDELSGLVCLATPWDFHAERPEQARLLGQSVGLLEPILQSLGELPVDAIQTLFATADPLQVVRKFMAFAEIDPRSPKAEQFVALEDWLNDGVPLAAPVARECLAGWYGENATARGQWRIAGATVEPAQIHLPTLVVVPDQDRIVAPASAAALAAALPNVTPLRPAAGHIGMVVGGGAEQALYRPLAKWLHQFGGAASGRSRSRLSRQGARPRVISQVRNEALKGASRRKGVKR